MNSLLICLIAAATITYIWDWVHFPNELANSIMSKLTNGKITHVELKKPLGCSLCMTTWVTLIILAIMSWKWIPMCLVFGWSTKYILYIYTLIDEFLDKVLLYLESIITK